MEGNPFANLISAPTPIIISYPTNPHSGDPVIIYVPIPVGPPPPNSILLSPLPSLPPDAPIPFILSGPPAPTPISFLPPFFTTPVNPPSYLDPIETIDNPILFIPTFCHPYLRSSTP
ncbi:hypothetical protein AMTRI_Chr07g76060 [Amborella trichopoda]